jgi:hypothetical protein
MMLSKLSSVLMLALRHLPPIGGMPTKLPKKRSVVVLLIVVLATLFGFPMIQDPDTSQLSIQLCSK